MKKEKDVEAKHTTVNELVALLKEATDLGLNFDVGTAYIRRSYIDQQTALRSRIKDAIDRAEAVTDAQ